MEKREFNPYETFKLIAVQNLDGTDKVQTRSLYRDRINCFAVGLQCKNFMNSPEKYYMTMDFVKNERGYWIQRRLITSEVMDVVDLEDGLAIQTKNSVYFFEKAELPTVVYLDEANMIELYLSQEEEYLFAKGIYYDCNKKPHELSQLVHSGMFQDSVLLELPEKSPVKGYACRYFPLWHEISFYDVLKHHGEYIPIVIHNHGEDDLTVYSPHQKEKIVIPPEETKRITSNYAE